MSLRIWILGVVAALMCGCRSGQKTPVEHGAPPLGYAETAAAYNRRVVPLERIYCTTTMTVWYPNEEGEQDRAQVEGHLNYIRPLRVSLTMEKVGEFVSGLGCNENQYWWIEKGEEPRARVGQMSQVTPERIAKLGIPVHPLDLVELLGISPLPEAGPDTTTKWSDDGRSIVVAVPGRMGQRRVWVDATTFEPSRIELLNSSGNVAVWATLEKYERVLVPGGQVGSRVATRMIASTLTDKIGKDGKPMELRVRLNLGEPEVSKDRPRPAVFDFDTLVKVYKVRNVEELE